MTDDQRVEDQSGASCPSFRDAEESAAMAAALRYSAAATKDEAVRPVREVCQAVRVSFTL